jgi:hypothetical protein
MAGTSIETRSANFLPFSFAPRSHTDRNSLNSFTPQGLRTHTHTSGVILLLDK